MKDDKIHFIITGGTIDSYYEPTKETTVPNKNSTISRFIKTLKLYEAFEFSELCMKDSRELTIKDVKKICETIEKSPHKKFIITHGTYTMSDTARYLKANLKKKDKVIIFTGSMIPLSGFAPSDAPFNLGFAVAKLEDLQNGIYICMNGKVFSSKEAVKSLSEGRFVSSFAK